MSSVNDRLNEVSKLLMDPEVLSNPGQYQVLAKEYAELKKQQAQDNVPVKAAIVEVRAGAGGEEAALFAAVLTRMYQRYAETKGWKVEILDKNKTPLGGYKEVSLRFEGSGVYEALEHESGVHRVQRIPETEKSGRIHTSTASVAVLPESNVQDTIEIKSEDLRIDTYRSGGKGGQHVNKTESAIRITHIPSGIVVAVQDERSQHKNKEKAMSILKSRLMHEMKQQGAAEISAIRKEQVGGNERSEKIRTYNYPQNRITDHRINKSWHQLDLILEGDVEPMITAYKAAQ